MYSYFSFYYYPPQYYSITPHTTITPHTILPAMTHSYPTHYHTLLHYPNTNRLKEYDNEKTLLEQERQELTAQISSWYIKWRNEVYSNRSRPLSNACLRDGAVGDENLFKALEALTGYFVWKRSCMKTQQAYQLMKQVTNPHGLVNTPKCELDDPPLGELTTMKTVLCRIILSAPIFLKHPAVLLRRAF